jgi:hypothetical protein
VGEPATQCPEHGKKHECAQTGEAGLLDLLMLQSFNANERTNEQRGSQRLQQLEIHIQFQYEPT